MISCLLAAVLIVIKLKIIAIHNNGSVLSSGTFQVQIGPLKLDGIAEYFLGNIAICDCKQMSYKNNEVLLHLF